MVYNIGSINNINNISNSSINNINNIDSINININNIGSVNININNIMVYNISSINNGTTILLSDLICVSKVFYNRSVSFQSRIENIEYYISFGS